MADKRRDDPDAPSISEMRALPVAVQQIARQNLPAIPDDPGHGEVGGEAHDIARARSLQTKGPSNGDGGAENWNALAGVAVSQDPDPEGDQGGCTPITGQGLPSFAQSEFYTVILFEMLTIFALIVQLSVRVDCPSSTP